MLLHVYERVISFYWALYKRIIFTLYVVFKRPNRLRLKKEEAIYEAKLLLISKTFQKCGKRLFIDFPVTLHNACKVEVGDDVAIGAYVLIWGGGGVKIGNRVMIAAHSVISSQSHDAKADQPRWTSMNLPIVIEDDVWIGAGSIILPGVTIGKCAVVGAATVVTKDVAPYSIVVGSPARQIRNKNQK